MKRVFWLSKVQAIRRFVPPSLKIICIGFCLWFGFGVLLGGKAYWDVHLKEEKSSTFDSRKNSGVEILDTGPQKIKPDQPVLGQEKQYAIFPSQYLPIDLLPSRINAQILEARKECYEQMLLVAPGMGKMPAVKIELCGEDGLVEFRALQLHDESAWPRRFQRCMNTILKKRWMSPSLDIPCPTYFLYP